MTSLAHVPVGTLVSKSALHVLGFCVKAILRFVQTGTLTENRMTVVEGWFAGKKYDKVPQPEDLPADFFNTLQASVAVNSSVSHS